MVLFTLHLRYGISKKRTIDLEIKFSYKIDSYKKINRIFIVIIVIIFFYCFIVPFLNYGFYSLCEGMPLSYCKSRGLTRAFAQILRFNFKEAIIYNPYCIKIFSFFLIELIARFIINLIVNFSNFKKVLTLDLFFSAFFFIFSFYNLVII
jgi:hypothetical protein